MEEDLARLLGDAPAHAMVQAVGVMAQAVQQFVGRGGRNGSDGTTA
jgi:ubiquinone biosynthesis protein UbiJ